MNFPEAQRPSEEWPVGSGEADGLDDRNVCELTGKRGIDCGACLAIPVSNEVSSRLPT
jgi:hypothetical protein